MSTEPKPESPAELAAEARRIAEAYGQAMYDAGMDANSDFSDRRYDSDRKRAEAREELEADLLHLAALATIQASASASQEPVHHTGQWSTDEIGANLYCSSFAHDLKLSIEGDFEDREARKDCADELVKILNSKSAATQARPASGEAR